jgi:hypothetical protein
MIANLIAFVLGVVVTLGVVYAVKNFTIVKKA